MDYFDTTADVGDEEEEEFDEDTGEAIEKPGKRNNMDDSSEEDDDDEDEEAEAAVREGFIVDEDDDEPENREERRRERKRRREERAEDEQLDEDDLDLIGVVPDDRVAETSKFKRLKRGHRDERGASIARGVEDIFSDEEDGDVGAAARRPAFGTYEDEMDGFIEQDEFEDEEGGQLEEDLGVRAPRRPGLSDLQNLKNSGLGEAEMEDMRGAFGDGEEFGWALAAEQTHNEELLDPEKPLELKDVFEPSQLEERMLTDKDNEIRLTDVPERFQLARAPYPDLSELSPEQFDQRTVEEATWITSILFPRKRMEPNLQGPFQSAVKDVLYFMNKEQLEPPFIFQNRKDHLIHSEQVPADANGADSSGSTIKAVKLLNQTDLWDIVEQDLKYRAFAERRDAIQKNVDVLREMETEGTFANSIFDDMLPHAAQMDDLQDLQDFLNFQYALQLKDLSLAEAETNGTQKRARGTRAIWDKLRSGPAYHLVRAFGITADGIAQNAEGTGHRVYPEDVDKRPDDLADTLIRDPDYKTGEDVLNAAKAMFVEEIVMSPRMRRHMRVLYYKHLVFDVYRTDKGLRQIDEQHPYWEFKYLRNQEVRNFLVDRPELFLRMMKAEAEGLVEVRIRLRGERRIHEELQKAIESDNLSEVADAWNVLRREVMGIAVSRLHRVITKGVKDNLKNECENKIAGFCRDAFVSKLDQAPYRPQGMELGTNARVLALSNGDGDRNNAICWAYVEESGRVLESGKLIDIRLGNERGFPEGKDVNTFVEVVERRRPDVVAVSGWSTETRRLYSDVKAIVEARGLTGTAYENDDDEEVRDPLDVVITQDEVARLYYTTERAFVDHPGVPPLTRYCIALAHYMQNPLKQYAGLKRNIISISFDPNQQLVPEDKLRRYLETAMVDIVNLVGVEINEAIQDPGTADLLPYVSGLGPRKADFLLKTVGGEVTSRNELILGSDRDGSFKRSAMGPSVFMNCASFLYIAWEDEVEADYLDNTRIHPEDYDIAKKMAADALEFDEEDVQAEQNDHGPNAVVRKLVKDEATDRVNDLVLAQYADQLEAKFSQKKRSTLETIRAELQNPYEELRRNFSFLSSDEQFTQLTGESRESLAEDMIIPVVVRRTFPDHIEVKLECGVDGGISNTEYPEEVVKNHLEPRQVWIPQQVIQAKLTFLDRKKFTAQLTLRENELKKPYRKHFDHALDEWDDDQEARDRKEAKKVSDAKSGRQQRVIKHPLFRPFNSQQAIEALKTQGRGDCIIRPSSKGPDHLAITWKIAEGVYQHLDVLELDKENEFSVGRTLKVQGKFSYSDLDELIALHIQAMVKKVDEMMADERYQKGTKKAAEQWLETYTEANPKRSMYAFCMNPEFPGYFHLCFKAGQNAPLAHWPVKVIPLGFELKNNRYPDMRALKNGFKLLFANQGPNGRR